MAKKADDAGENIQGYFRPILLQNPKLLKGRNNDELYQRWLSDHPGQTEVPERVKSGLSNLKSTLRRERKMKKKQRQAEAAAGGGEAAVTRTPRRRSGGLDTLELQIDDCLVAARSLDSEGLAPVIQLLREARNEVVMRGKQ